MSQSPLITADELSKQTGLTVNEINNLRLNDHKFPHSRFSRKCIKYRLSEVNKYIESRTIKVKEAGAR
jgi:predicted DNA-binding transcriptional regulator AlpA